MGSPSWGDGSIVSELSLIAFPSRGFLAALRAVNRSWHRHLRRVLALPGVRRSLGCHHWDGTMACRKIDLSCSAGLTLEHASWIPGTDRLLCVCFPKPSELRRGITHGEFCVFGCDGVLQNTIVFDDFDGYLVDVCFIERLKFVCVVAGWTNIVVISSAIEGMRAQSTRINLELGGPDIVVRGESMPKVSTDGMCVAYPVYLTDVSVARMMQQGLLPEIDSDDEDYWDGEEDLGWFVVMVDIQTHRTLWKASFGEHADVIGFIDAGLLVMVDQSGSRCFFLVDRAIGTTIHIYQINIEMHWRHHCCISPDGSRIVNGQFILEFVPGNNIPMSLAQQVRLEAPVEDSANAGFEWSLDGSRLFCIRGKFDAMAKLDVFDARTGSLLWRRHEGFGLGCYNAPKLSISSDGCCLAVTKHGALWNNDTKEHGIRIFVPAVILF